MFLWLNCSQWRQQKLSNKGQVWQLHVVECVRTDRVFILAPTIAEDKTPLFHISKHSKTKNIVLVSHGFQSRHQPCTVGGDQKLSGVTKCHKHMWFNFVPILQLALSKGSSWQRSDCEQLNKNSPTFNRSCIIWMEFNGQFNKNCIGLHFWARSSRKKPNKSLCDWSTV